LSDSRRHTCCFFFQAEDGIRDFHVTGVQTCALPISAECSASVGRRTGTNLGGRNRWNSSKNFARLRPSVLGSGTDGSMLCFGGRSEERRVGKEGTARQRGGQEKSEP